MCYRYYIGSKDPALEAILQKTLASSLREKFEKESGRSLISEGEVRPTDIVPVIASNRSGDRSAFPMKWGFSMPNSKNAVVNARVETAATKPMFREAWQRRRCIVPASWYFEWEHIPAGDGKTKTGDKFSIRPAGCDHTWLCGLYTFERDLPVFAVITREPGENVARIHDRMPLILPEDKIDEWIRPDITPETLLPYALTYVVLTPASPQQCSFV